MTTKRYRALTALTDADLLAIQTALLADIEKFEKWLKEDPNDASMWESRLGAARSAWDRVMSIRVAS